MGCIFLFVSVMILRINSFHLSKITFKSSLTLFYRVRNPNSQANKFNPDDGGNHRVKKSFKNIVVDAKPLNRNYLKPAVAEIYNYYSFAEYYNLADTDEAEARVYVVDFFLELCTSKVLVAGQISIGMERFLECMKHEGNWNTTAISNMRKIIQKKRLNRITKTYEFAELMELARPLQSASEDRDPN